MRTRKHGFTLIEMSIVLVVIGLIVGGILSGRSLISASEAQAQLTQIQKFQAAVSTFYGKYGFLPGDIKNPEASQFGFAARGTLTGEGDGNGILQGISSTQTAYGMFQGAGETAMFWVDLGVAHLIDVAFSTASPTTMPGGWVYQGVGGLDNYFPHAKLGNGTYITVYSNNGVNYFNLGSYWGLEVGGGCDGCLGINSPPGLTVAQANAIDAKIDDGLPQSGRVTASYNAYDSLTWAGTVGTGQTAGSPTTCYDNSSAAIGSPGIAGAAQHYSVEISNGANIACALSFQFN